MVEHRLNMHEVLGSNPVQHGVGVGTVGRERRDEAGKSGDVAQLVGCLLTPPFLPQHHINQLCWNMPAIPLSRTC